MKTLSMMQPWAQLVVIGAKQFETRSWATTYRGPLAIHASKTFTRETAKLVMLTEPFKTVLTEAGFPLLSLMPRGVIIAVCELVDVMATDVALQFAKNVFLETAFGDFSRGRFAWKLENIRALPEPIPSKGTLGLWECRDERLHGAQKHMVLL